MRDPRCREGGVTTLEQVGLDRRAAARAHTAPQLPVSGWAADQQCLHAAILAAHSRPLSPGIKLLDLGCGDGALLKAYRSVGVEAHGCDFPPVASSPFLWPIQRQPYRLPFADRQFDIVVSQTVMEHVQDWDGTLREVARVMKPDGCTLHLFPARLRPVEAHVLVPFAGVLQRPWWLALWASLGVRNRYQSDMSRAEVVADNEAFLAEHTSYPTRRQVTAAFSGAFSEVRFCDREMILHGSRRARRLAPVLRCLPAIASVYGTLAMVSVLASGPRW